MSASPFSSCFPLLFLKDLAVFISVRTMTPPPFLSAYIIKLIAATKFSVNEVTLKPSNFLITAF